MLPLLQAAYALPLVLIFLHSPGYMLHQVEEHKAILASQLLAKLADRPNAANRLRTHAKALSRWGIAVGLAKTNPWEATTRLRISSAGYATWSEADIDTFVKCWPVGTWEYLALALMLATCARRGDAIRLGPQHIASGRLRFRTRKTGVEIDVPIRDELTAALTMYKAEHAIFLVTVGGAPFTHAGFGNWFGGACKTAGVTARAHGLRKAAARRLAERRGDDCGASSMGWLAVCSGGGPLHSGSKSGQIGRLWGRQSLYSAAKCRGNFSQPYERKRKMRQHGDPYGYVSEIPVTTRTSQHIER